MVMNWMVQFDEGDLVFALVVALAMADGLSQGKMGRCRFSRKLAI